MSINAIKGGIFKIRSRTEIGKRLAETLLRDEVISPKRVEQLRNRAVWLDIPLARLLLQEGVVAEERLIKMLATITGVPVMNVARIDVDEQVLESVSVRTVTKFNIMPVKIGKGVVTLLTDHVWDATDEDQLRVIIGYAIEWVLVPSDEISECIKHYYGIGIESYLGIAAQEREGGSAASSSTEDEGLGIISFVHEIIKDAVSIDATDIHIEPFENRLKVRYRIDGVLQTFPLPSGIEDYSKAVISSVKVMAQMNIAEHRKPQDGRFSITINQETFDIRVSVLPMQFGETLNMRILNRGATFIDLNRLGLADENRAELEDLISVPYGMVLFTGPTGSGKTTSLYATLVHLNNDSRKVITLEDPIEYRLEGITQMQMDERAGLSFASGLRSVLRHDPDIVLVGEIRDSETADIAVSAALTGHLVFSTLHTNDSVGALTRLLDMKVEPFLVSSALEGAIAQRLMRKICPQCREQIELDDNLYRKLTLNQVEVDAKPAVFRGRGCPHCRFTGYRGRQPIFEIMRMDDELRSLTAKHSSTAELMDCAIKKKGLETLRQRGWRKVLEGVSTVEELLRVTRGDY